MRIREATLRIRVVTVLLLVGLAVVVSFWLMLDRPSKSVRFEGSYDFFEAAIWSKSIYDKFDGTHYLYLQAENVTISLGRYLKVSQWDWEYPVSKPDRLPALLELATTRETVERLPEAFISASDVTLSATGSIGVTLWTHGHFSLRTLTSRLGTYVDLTLENPSDRERTIRIEAAEGLPLDLTIQLDEYRPIKGVLTSWGLDPAPLTIYLGKGKETFSTSSNTSPWVGLRFILRNGMRVSCESNAEKRNGGLFWLTNSKGQLDIGDETPESRTVRYLRILDGRFDLSESKIIVGGVAEQVSTPTAGQVLPRRWDVLSGLAQIIITTLAVAILGAAVAWLWRGIKGVVS